MKEVILEMLSVVALSVLSIVGTYVSFYVNAKMRDFKETKAYKELYEETDIVVRALEEETAKELREMLKDGKIDREELAKMKDVAIVFVKKRVTKWAKNLISKDLEGNTEVTFDEYIGDLIEATLSRVKGVR